jgi:hypothetical protein
VFNKEYLLAHESFMVAKDYSWFTDELVPVVKKYSGLGVEDGIENKEAEREIETSVDLILA